jgi:EAL domain-containing protein (putative c-di-GMP-specific phosphodiesterase class I)
VTSALADAGVDAHRLHLEVTETALLQVTDTVRDTMEQLAGLGVAWWVDDFGTGFSSISHLRDLPISGLKLDRTFTAGLTLNDTHATRLAQGLAGLAAGLGLQTVAEGVETIEQVNVLMSQGWQMGQGWLYGQAAPPAV